jgi:hypothetical protein
MTTLLIALGVWLVVSLALAPLVGYYLSAVGRRSAKKEVESPGECDVHGGARPPA